MSQGVSWRPFSAEARFDSQPFYVTYVMTKWHGGIYSSGMIPVFPYHYHSINVKHSLFIHQLQALHGGAVVLRHYAKSQTVASSILDAVTEIFY